MALLAGGASAQLVRDTGSPNAVQGFNAAGSLGNANLSTALPFNALFQAGDGSAILNLQSLVNALRYGTFTPANLYYGSNLVTKVYLGNTLVYG